MGLIYERKMRFLDMLWQVSQLQRLIVVFRGKLLSENCSGIQRLSIFFIFIQIFYNFIYMYYFIAFNRISSLLLDQRTGRWLEIISHTTSKCLRTVKQQSSTAGFGVDMNKLSINIFCTIVDF
ncbi:Hypothetical_protein [Hexamita inflata]|uniref:Hypothetical_protein n=1 Tax=Hexamita inflata TaxID=28002 RepID=A0AA86QGT0_9EUKA|nr:Hypothetical protein HINF_LOCUS46656 [Hexamita inflata]